MQLTLDLGHSQQNFRMATATLDIREEPFPARSRSASGLVHGVPTEVTSLEFSDKILITISQEGRLAQWIQVPMMGTSAGIVDMALPSNNHGLLPSTHLAPKTLLGGGGDDRETLGQLYASQIASHISLRSPEERRTLVFGFGLAKAEKEQEAFFDLFELALKVL